jgi:hypothetical protein
VFEFTARTIDVEIVLIDPPASQFSVEGELHGFGLPTSRLNAFVDFKPDPLPTLYYRVEQTGWFTDLNGAATVLVPAAGLARVVVRLGHGNIRVWDMTRSGVVRSGILHLDLKTASGHVQAGEPVTSISNVPAVGPGSPARLTEFACSSAACARPGLESVHELYGTGFHTGNV